MSHKILVVSAHLGDEILGCGGVLALHAEAGDEVRVVILGEGWTSRTKSVEKGLEAVDLEKFEEQGRHALQALGITDVRFHRLPDNRFDTVPLLEVIKLIELEKTHFAPDKVYTSSAFDLGIDQRLACQATVTAFRPRPTENLIELVAFEIRSSTEWNYTGGGMFVPNLFIDVSRTLDRKIEAFGLLQTENRGWPHSRSLDAIRHYAHARGSEVGLEAGEAFAVMRAVRKQP